MWGVNMNKKKFFIHALGIFLTITALQAFTVTIELTKEAGIIRYTEYAKTVLAKDLWIKIFISLLTGFIIVRYMTGSRVNRQSKSKGTKKHRR